MHDYAVVLMLCHKEFIFSYGYDMKLVKYNFKNKTQDKVMTVDSNITALKLLKTLDEANKVKVAASFSNGQITVYDLNLVALKSV